MKSSSSAKKTLKKMTKSVLGKGSRTIREVNHIQAYRSTLDNQPQNTESKSVIQLIEEKLISSQQSFGENTDTSSSQWVGSDVLYITGVLRRERQRKTASTQPQQYNNNVNYDRNILILRHNDAVGSKTAKQNKIQSISNQSQGKLRKDRNHIYLLYLIHKDGQLDVKHYYDLRALKSVDYGADDTELVLSFDSNSLVNLNLYLPTQMDRDECIFVIMELARYVLNIYSQITVGYSIDVESLRFNNIDINSAVLNKFPKLTNVMRNCGNGYNVSNGMLRPTSGWTEFLNEEESEAENLLDELNWSVTDGDHKTLHQTLSSQSEALNMEIIDLLLQWEEMDDKNSNLNSTNNNNSYSGNSKGFNNNTMAKFKGSGNATLGVRDTSEVLSALQMVVEELEGVDNWLNVQINHISEIQANLHLIEDKSGTLETTWQNLNDLQNVVSLLVSGYTVSAEHEEILKSPEKTIQLILKGADLSDVGKILAPLLAAAVAVRNSLQLKLPRDVKNISPLEWKQLQATTAVSSQKAKIAALAEGFCRGVHDTMLGLFDWLLKHKTFIEGSSKSDGVASKLQYAMRNTIDECNRSKLQFFLQAMTTTKHNILLHVCNVFRNSLTPFLPLISIFLDLSPENILSIHFAYSNALHERLFNPTIKSICKDLAAAINSKHICVSLAYPFRYHSWTTSHSKVDLPLLFEFARVSNSSSSQQSIIQPWVAFKIALSLLIPAVMQEEEFVKETFNLKPPPAAALMNDTTTIINNNKDNYYTKMMGILDTIFESTVGKIEAAIHSHSPSPTNDVDGIEAIAMLTTLHMCVDSYRSFSYMEDVQTVIGDTAQLKKGPSELPMGTPYVYKLFETLRSNLWARIQCFISEQIQWINSQKADAKAAEVLLPFVRFPLLILQVREMTVGMQQFDSVVSNIFHNFAKIATELFQWLSLAAKQSDKYTDKIKMTNFGYFEVSVGSLDEPVLKNFVSNASQQKQEATIKYVNWMVSYEFPALSALAARMDGVGSKVHGEELSLYIRRKDVMTVVEELDAKTLEANIHTLRKRLAKHFKSEYDVDLQLVSKTWQQIKDRVCSILQRLEEAALASYQITLVIGARVVQDMFDKHT